MSALQLKNLSNETLMDIAPSVLGASKISEEKSRLLKQIKKESELVGVKELAFMMNHLELRSICDDFIKVEYKEGTNRNNKMHSLENCLIHYSIIFLSMNIPEKYFRVYSCNLHQ